MNMERGTRMNRSMKRNWLSVRFEPMMYRNVTFTN